MVGHIKRLKPPFHIEQWLFVVTQHQINSYYRSLKRAKNQTISLDSINEAELIKKTDSSAISEQVQQIIKKLPPAQASVFKFRLLDGLSTRQIMCKTRKSFWAVQNTLTRAKKRFKKMYEEKYGRYLKQH